MGRERVMGEIAEWAMPMAERIGHLTGAPAGLMSTIVEAARQRAFELEDPQLAPRAAERVLNALFAAEDPPRAWWATEAGLLCARAIGYHRPTAPLTVAASILNVSRQRVSQLCDEERLIRVDVPRDGITRDSIRYELLAHGRRVRR
jgi:hypothetical protein